MHRLLNIRSLAPPLPPLLAPLSPASTTTTTRHHRPGPPSEGPLMGGPQCRLSIFKNGNVPCCYFRNFPVDFKNSVMSPVDFEKWQRPLSVIFKCSCQFYGASMSPVDFKKWLCHPVKFKGQGPRQRYQQHHFILPQWSRGAYTMIWGLYRSSILEGISQSFSRMAWDAIKVQWAQQRGVQAIVSSSSSIR